MRDAVDGGAGRDAVVVGGGVVGLSVARALGRRGLSVAVVERGRVGAEASWAAAGMLAPQSEADRPDAFFRLAAAARDDYPAFAAALSEETGIDIELDETGTLYVALREDEAAECERRFDWQRRAGLAVERLTGAEARALEPNLSPRLLMALRFPSDWQVENRRLVSALALSARRAGVEIHEQTAALSVRTAAGRVRAVETPSGEIETDAVVVACGAWSSLLPVKDDAAGASLPRARGGPDFAGGESGGARGESGGAGAESGGAEVPRVEPVRGQMLCYETSVPFARHVLYGARGYLVPRRDGRLLAGSTTERAGFDKSVTPAGRAEIAAHAEEIAPAAGRLKLAAEWAGLRPHAADDWPLVGAHGGVGRLFYAAAHYRNGILLAPLTGRLVADMMAGARTPELLAPFSPERFRRAATCAG